MDKRKRGRPKKVLSAPSPIISDGGEKAPVAQGPELEPVRLYEPAGELAASAGVAAQPAPPASPVPPAPEMFNAATVEVLLRAVGRINVMGALLVTKMPVEQAVKIWGFTQVELDELNEPAKDLCNKYLPDWIRTHQAEFRFALVLIPMLVAKLHLTVAAMREARAAKPSGTNGEARGSERAATAPASPAGNRKPAGAAA